MANPVVKASMLKSEVGMQTNKSGFTLIEILVVIVILGITARVALMAFGDFGKNRRIEAEAHNIAERIRLVRNAAILESTPYRININGQQNPITRFVQQDQWESKTVLKQNHLSIPHQLTTQSTITLQASGEITPFTLTLGINGKPPIARIEGKSNGTICVKTASAVA
jgi:general secretion pathway protein H